MDENYQLEIYILGRAYLSGKADKHVLAKEAKTMLKNDSSIGYAILSDTKFPFPKSILFAWGRVMWQENQIDLTMLELVELFGETNPC